MQPFKKQSSWPEQFPRGKATHGCICPPTNNNNIVRGIPLSAIDPVQTWRANRSLLFPERKRDPKDRTSSICFAPFSIKPCQRQIVRKPFPNRSLLGATQKHYTPIRKPLAAARIIPRIAPLWTPGRFLPSLIFPCVNLRTFFTQPVQTIISASISVKLAFFFGLVARWTMFHIILLAGRRTLSTSPGSASQLGVGSVHPGPALFRRIGGGHL
jgi:hypothetical protein